MAELEYPNTGAKERFVSSEDASLSLLKPRLRFILLAPKDKDHYNPIMDLEKSLLTIVKCQSSFVVLLYHLRTAPF